MYNLSATNKLQNGGTAPNRDAIESAVILHADQCVLLRSKLSHADQRSMLGSKLGGRPRGVHVDRVAELLGLELPPRDLAQRVPCITRLPSERTHRYRGSGAKLDRAPTDTSMARAHRRAEGTVRTQAVGEPGICARCDERG